MAGSISRPLGCLIDATRSRLFSDATSCVQVTDRFNRRRSRTGCWARRSAWLLAVASVTACSGTGVEPPSGSESSAVALFEGTRAEWGERMVACLREGGVDAHASEDLLNELYTVDGITSAEALDALGDAEESCQARVGELGGEYGTPEEITRTYEHLLLVAACLRRQGQPVPDPPSLAQWTQHVAQPPPEGTWHPYDLVPATLPDGRLARPVLERLCPSSRWMMTELGLTMH